MSVERTDLGYETAIVDLSFDAAIDRVVEALKAEGFGVLTEIDVTATLKAKLGVDFRPYTILGACNPQLAHQALRARPDIGILLPCNVTVERAEGADGVRVRIANPKAMFRLVDDPDLAPVADDADARLARVAEALAAGR